MREQVLARLVKGEWPDTAAMRQWLRLALVKKMGVLNQPYHCWSNDSKINPASRDLLLVATLLDDRESLAAVEGVLAAEAEIRGQAAGQWRQTVCAELARELAALPDTARLAQAKALLARGAEIGQE